MIEKLVYKKVLKDLMKIPMLTGIYDAKNGNKSYMQGICTVMETIACKAGEKKYYEFDELFAKNITESEGKLCISQTED